jgi:hypothetical protein
MSEATIKRGARFYVDDQGIIRGREADGAGFELQDAQEAIAAIRELAAGRKRALVVDISDLRTMTRDARAYFTHKDHAEFLYAVALVVRSLLSRAIGNFIIGFNRPAVPTRLFNDDEDALAWLRTFIPKDERP